MTHRWSFQNLALVAAWALTALCAGPAAAQQGVLQQVAEPKRFALVIGNAKYGDPDGNLTQLGAPCSGDPKTPGDAETIAAAFTDAGWDVTKSCNLKTADLSAAITSFNATVAKEPRAFGVIYFSGHGAQVAKSNYLFGVDAFVDTAVEANTYKQNSQARLFATAAVPLDRIMQDVEPLWGKAVVVIVDACRDDPILRRLQDAGINTARYPAAASSLDNMVFAFATKDGLTAPDGGVGGSSRYTKLLAAAIRAAAANPPQEIEPLLSWVKTQVQLATHRNQTPEKAGELQRPPTFCIKGCPSRLDQWQSLNQTYETPDFSVPSDAGASPAPASTASPAVAPVAFRPPPVRRSAGLIRISAARQETSAAAGGGTAPGAHVDASAAVVRAISPPTRSVRFDILYCVGDDLAAVRKAKAAVLKTKIEDLDDPAPVAGFDIGRVRTIALPADVNARQYHAVDSSVIADKSDPIQVQWAQAVSQATTPPLFIVNKKGGAPDYFNIVVCDGATPAETPPVIYLQAARDDQKGQASLVRDSLLGAIPHAEVAKKTQVIEKSPDLTEVRFFAPAEKGQADTVANLVSGVTGHPVRTQFVAGYEKKLKGSTLIEVWLGKTEPTPTTKPEG